MADDDHGLGVARQMLLQPQRAFEIEIVGRLVEQQQIGFGEQRRRERHAHAPAAGEFRARTLLVGGGEAEPGEDRSGARRRRVRADIGEPRLDLGDAVRVMRRFRLGQQCPRCAVGLEHDLEQAFRAVGGFLRQASDAPARRHLDVAVLGRNVAGDHAEQRGLAAAVAADQPTRAPSVMRAMAPSISGRPAMRTVRSSMTSMRALWPRRRRDAIPPKS